MAKNTRIALFFICDLICFNISYLLAFVINAVVFPEPLSLAEAINAFFSVYYTTGFLILIIVKLAAMYVSSVYRIMLEYANTRDLLRVALSLVTSTLASVTAAALIGIAPALLPPVILLSFIFDMSLVLIIRRLYIRQVTSRREDYESEGEGLRRKYSPKKKPTGHVMIIGANRAAVDLITEMREKEGLGRKPEIIIDDDKSHDGDILLGIEIVAQRSEIRRRARAHLIEEIIIAKPDASKRQLAALLRECVKTTRCRISMLPLERSNENTSASTQAATLADLRKPTVADLLGRERPRVDHRKIGDEFKGRVVLVTGGAGVFGSELCRRIIRYKPRRLIALDIDEDGLAMLTTELEEYNTAETEFHAVIASVRDATMMRRAFGGFRPHIVFHAAELKQIPLAQINPRETFLTNVLGLKTACDLADEYAADKFILCSTVRAAEPANVAAQCKRAAELYVAEKNEKSHTIYSSLRFPNLIEGRGNVIAIFEKQLSKGGPLTVTGEDIVRRFISAEEAALLSVRAATLAEGGEIFEIGPGEPIGIRDLAEAIIQLDGKILDKEIKVVITQLRAGDRFFEEAEEYASRSVPHPAERIWITEDKYNVKLPHWSQLWPQDPERMDDMAVIEILRMIFPTYKMKASGVTSKGVKIDHE